MHAALNRGVRGIDEPGLDTGIPTARVNQRTYPLIREGRQHPLVGGVVALHQRTLFLLKIEVFEHHGLFDPGGVSHQGLNRVPDGRGGLLRCASLRVAGETEAADRVAKVIDFGHRQVVGIDIHADEAGLTEADASAWSSPSSYRSSRSQVLDAQRGPAPLVAIAAEPFCLGLKLALLVIKRNS
jgi:hypothetical protein